MSDVNAMALERRLDRADAPGHDLDEEIWALLVAPNADMASEPQRYTFSIDDAMTLVDRVRPGADVGLEMTEMMTDGKVRRVTDATIYKRAYGDEQDVTAYANSPALALCLVALRAHIAQGGT